MSEEENIKEENELVLASGQPLFSGKLLENYLKLDLELLNLPEKTLEDYARPNITMQKIKRQLWKRIQVAKRTGESIPTWELTRTICTSGAFNNIVSNQHKLAWLLQPMNRYEDDMEAALDLASRRYDELLSMSIKKIKKRKNKDGKDEEYESDEIDTTKAKTLLAVIARIEDRVKGLALQKTLNISETKPAGEIKGINTEAVEARIKELELKLGLGGQHDAIECESTVLATTEGTDDGEDS